MKYILDKTFRLVLIRVPKHALKSMRCILDKNLSGPPTYTNNASKLTKRIRGKAYEHIQDSESPKYAEN